MQKIIKCICFLFTILIPCHVHAQLPSNATYPYTDELNKYINKNFGEHVIVQKSDYDKDTLSFFQPTTQVIGDFDGNYLLDICLIIKLPKKGISIISFHINKSGFSHFVLEENEGSDYLRETLIQVGPSSVVTISMADEPKKTKYIANAAIAVEWIEACYDTLYLWEKDHYVSY